MRAALSSRSRAAVGLRGEFDIAITMAVAVGMRKNFASSARLTEYDFTQLHSPGLFVAIPNGQTLISLGR